jgi:hypothetical protein
MPAPSVTSCVMIRLLLNFSSISHLIRKQYPLCTIVLSFSKMSDLHQLNLDCGRLGQEGDRAGRPTLSSVDQAPDLSVLLAPSVVP